MSFLEGKKELVIHQEKEWGEILTNFETKNKYSIKNESGEKVGYAAEEGGSFLGRIFLKSLRPFKIIIANTAQEIVIRVERPFKFYFHEITIFDEKGLKIGLVKREFSLFSRVYSVCNSRDIEIYKIHGPLLKPWTFNIQGKNQEKYGKITKKWSGLLKEAMTDADNFGIEFPAEWSSEYKAIFLGAVFLIDFIHFENNNRS